MTLEPHEDDARLVGLTSAVLDKVRDRCQEHAHLKRQEKAIAARCEAIADEVDGLLHAAGQGEALYEGLEVDGHRVKLVAGETSRLNLETLVRLGCDPQWIEQATTRVPRKVHLRFTHPAEE